VLAALSWWLASLLLGVAALPLAWRFYSRLPSRGYGAAKALGLFLTSYILWLGASFRLLPNALGGILVSLLLVVALSAWLGREGWMRGPDGARPLVAWLERERGLILVVEALFAVSFFLWVLFRSYNPEIAGTEKPMEFAFINGVLRSAEFPPRDPWLSGYAISYYHFGYVMLGLLIRLTGVDPAVGFNLGVALWFALVLVGAFGVAYDLASLARRSDSGKRSSLAIGGLGALFVGILGNLEAVVELAYHRRLVPEAWIQWLDIKQLTDSPPVADWSNQFWWWWRASRVIHDKDLLGNSVEVIDEFPFFSFLLGDLHPHVLALPFVLLAVAAALHVALSGLAEREIFEGWRGRLVIYNMTGMGLTGLLLLAAIFGALGFLNTWDYPIYVALLTLSIGASLAFRDGLNWSVIWRAALSGAAVGVLGWVVYFPFYMGFQSQFGGILPNLLFPSRFSQFFVMYGPFLVILFICLLLLSRRVGGVGRRFLISLPFTLLLPLLLAGLVTLFLTALPQGQEYVQSLLDNPAVQQAVGGRNVSELAALAVRLRAATPWTFLALGVLLAWVIALGWSLVVQDAPRTRQAPATQARDVADLYALLMAGLALLLALVVEFVYLRDLFGTRMNTVFKLYYQTWILLALASAYGLGRIVGSSASVWLKAPAVGFAGLLIVAGMLYPLAATPSKANQFRGEPTLDGLAFMRLSQPSDVMAIEWIRANVNPEAVVVESSGGSYSSEGAGRVSMATGNPTLLGWDFHEMQWRGDAYGEMVAGRPEALDRIYRLAPPEELSGLLARWDADFVYVGDLERRKYGIGEAALNRLDRALRRVYDRDGVIIYAP
jgi:YYY domain-containing protein